MVYTDTVPLLCLVGQYNNQNCTYCNEKTSGIIKKKTMNKNFSKNVITIK